METSTHRVSPLRQRMLEDMRMRKLAPKTRDAYLRATTQPEPADAFLIAVPTPFKSDHNGDHEPDLSYIESSSKAIAPVLKKGDLVILESTSPVGTTEQMAGWLQPDQT